MDTKAPETLNGMEVVPFEQLIADARERYCNAISDALDAEVARFVIPSDRIALLHDAAAFCVFMCALKCAEVRTPAGTPIDSRAGIKEWRPIKKKLDDELGPMLVEWGIAARQAQVKGSGDEAGEAN